MATLSSSLAVCHHQYWSVSELDASDDDDVSYYVINYRSPITNKAGILLRQQTRHSPIRQTLVSMCLALLLISDPALMMLSMPETLLSHFPPASLSYWAIINQPFKEETAPYWVINQCFARTKLNDIPGGVVNMVTVPQCVINNRDNLSLRIEVRDLFSNHQIAGSPKWLSG